MQTSVIVGTISTVLAASAIFTNGLFLVVLYKRPSLRKTFSPFQIAYLIGEIVFGIGSVVQYVDLMRVVFITPWYTAYYCILTNFPLACSGIFLLMTALALSVERLTALTWPEFFRNFNKKYVYTWITMFNTIFSIFLDLISFYGINNDIKPKSCSPNAVRINYLRFTLSYFYCVSGILIILTYSAVYVQIWRKSALMFSLCNENGPNDRNQRAVMFRDEIKACRVISVLIIAFTLYYILPNLILAVTNFLNLTAAADVGVFVTFFASCNCLVGLPVYLWKDTNTRLVLSVKRYFKIGVTLFGCVMFTANGTKS
uniref:G-protein coupled receptors family 1 profile domain-containing protein n=1 Tax=Romanomermis culicivorax TaxID=13658 RepID=A0A915I537_ROMCU